MVKSIRWIWAAAAVLSLVFGPAVHAGEKKGTGEKKTAKDFVEKELLIKFKLGENEKGNAKLKEIGAVVLGKLSQIDISRLKLPKGLTVEKAVAMLSKLDFVEFVEPNFIQHLTGGPNDPRYKDQWGMEKIRALKAWGIHTGRANTVIAVVDTGLDLNHPEFKNKIVKGYSFIEDNDKPMDDESHGTHCAGIAAATANNKEGIAGVCPNCSVMPVRALGGNGSGTTATVSDGILFAADHGADVISMSFGSPAYSTTLKSAIDYAAKKGIVLVAAAGNDGVSSLFYPAAIDSVIAVGSVTEFNDQRSYFSNFGDWVDVAAPGSDILSTVPNGYSYKQGTSMAAPFVSGLAGLLVSCSGASASKVRSAIESSAVPVGDWVNKGRIDIPGAMAAVGCTAGSKAPEDGTPPSKSPTGDGSSTKTPTGGGAEQKAPPPATPKFGAPASYKVVHGNALKEPKDALVTSDDSRLGLSSKGSGMANFLDLSISVPMKADVTYTSLNVSLEAYSEGAGNYEVQLKNTVSGSWDKVGTVRLENSESTVSVEVADAKNYVAKNGEVQIRLYRTEKLWNGFEIGVDQVSVKGAEKPAVPDKKTPDTKTPDTKTPDPNSPDKKEPEQDKSTGDKAKDMWNNLKKKF